MGAWGGKLPEDELIDLIASFFSDSRSLDLETVEHGNEGNPALTLRYRKLQLVGIDAGPGLSPKIRDAIAAALEREVGQTGTIVSRTFGFADRPVRGWWRYRDQMQILPPPPSARLPQMLFAEHPFVLECSVRTSQLPTLQMMRQQRASGLNALLLNALANATILPPALVSRSHWVYDRPVPQTPEGVMYAQEGYFVQGYPMTTATFTDTASLEPVTVESHADHFTGFGGIDASSPTLKVAESLPTLLDVFHSLEAGSQRAFERACYWFGQVAPFRNLSVSAAFDALVQAIEALLPDESGPICPECKRPAGLGPTRRYMDFVENYAPGIDEKDRRELYSVRSGIVHGGRLLRGDLPWSGSALDASRRHQHDVMMRAYEVTRRCLVTWLAERSPEPLPPLLDWHHHRIGPLMSRRVQVAGPGGPAADYGAPSPGR